MAALFNHAHNLDPADQASQQGLFEPAPNLSSLKVGALLNTASGSCDADAEADLVEICGASGIDLAKVWCVQGPRMPTALAEAKAFGLHLLIVLGGDGTIRSAAALCAQEGPMLIPLPGGTMNMLPKAFYGPRSWREALRDTLSAPVLQAVSGGEVAGERFYVAGIFGNPSLWAKAREAVREGDLALALEHGHTALEKSFAGGLRHDVNGVSDEVQAVSVLCPLTSRALSPDAPALEVAALNPNGAFSALKLVLRGLVSDWRTDSSVTVERAANFRLTSQEPIPAILDGESMTLSPSETVRFVPRAFIAVRPAPQPTAVSAEQPA